MYIATVSQCVCLARTFCSCSATVYVCVCYLPGAHVAVLQHPSAEPGVGRRWGWNLQYDGSANSAVLSAHTAGPLQHINHTSLGLVGLQEHQPPQALLHPGPHTRPPTAPRWAGQQLNGQITACKKLQAAPGVAVCRVYAYSPIIGPYDRARAVCAYKAKGLLVLTVRHSN